MEGNLCFKIDWANLIFGSKFTIFALFYSVFEGNFPSKSPMEGRFNGAFFCVTGYMESWTGLFSEFLR